MRALDSPITYWPVNVLPPKFPVQIQQRINHSSNPGCFLHWHEQLEFYYIEQGGLCLLCDGQERWIYPGDVAFVNWCDLHKSLEFLDNTVHYIIQLDLSLLSSSPQDIFDEIYVNDLIVHSRNFDRFILQDPDLSRLFQDIVAEYERKSYGYELAINADFLKIFSIIFRKYYRNQRDTSLSDCSLRYVREVLIYLSYHYGENDVIDTLSSKIGISKNYLSRIFRSHTGCTVVHYINQFRCYKAMSLIAEGVSITSAALQVGYNDYNYFSRVFKQIVGFSPSHLAKKRR